MFVVFVFQEEAMTNPRRGRIVWIHFWRNGYPAYGEHGEMFAYERKKDAPEGLLGSECLKKLRLIEVKSQDR